MTMSFKVHYQHSVFFNRYLDELEVANVGRTTTTSPAIQQNPSRWRPPDDDACVKINVDGAVSRSGRTGACAAICRDKEGNYIGASAVVFEGLVHAASLEAQACNEALALAQDLHLSHVIRASDCMQVVSDINDAAQSSSYACVIEEIKVRTLDFVKVSFRFENREANCEAHALAKAASTLPIGRHVWLGTTPDIICIPSDLVDE